MSALISSRVRSLVKGLVPSITAQAKFSSTCGSCGNVSASSWRKLGRPWLSQSYSSRARPVVARESVMALEDIDSEEREALEQQAGKVKGKIPPVEELLQADPSLRSPDYFQVHNLFTVRDLYDARVHLGHKEGSLNSRMNDFIFGTRFDTVIFDLDKTAFHLRQALNFMAHVAYRKGIILFVTRSPHAIHLVEQTAIECGEYAHCRDWHTHIMTNSENKFGGITRLPDLIIFLNTLDTVMATHRAVFDANKMLIPTVGVVDSNCDPNLIVYPIPGNDDSLPAIQFYCKVFKEAIMRGKQKRKAIENQQQEKLEKSGSSSSS